MGREPGNAYQNRKRQELRKSVSEGNARYPKAGKPVSREWSAGGHAPKNISKERAQQIKNWLKKKGLIK